MDIIIESPGFKAGDKIEAYIREKLSKLESHGANIIRANVTLFMGPPNDPLKCHCELRLEVPGNDHFVKKGAPTYEQAAQETIETIEKLLQKNKDKHIDRRQQNNDILLEETGTDLEEL